MSFVAQSTLSDLNFKKFLIVFILPFVSVLMFYQMSFGLNMAVFGLVVNLLILSDTEVSAKEKLAYLVIAIALCFNFFWYADEISFFSLFCWTIFIAFRSMDHTTPTVFFPFIYFFNLLIFPVRIFLGNTWLPEFRRQDNILGKAIAFIVIPFIILSVFLFLYTTIEPRLMLFFKFDIELNFEIVFIYLFSFYMIFNLIYMYIPDILKDYFAKISIDYNFKLNYKPRPTFDFLDIHLEKKSGEIAFTLLNIVIIVLLVLYNQEVRSQTLSEDLRQHVNTIIFSIIMAIFLIMFYFQGSFNFISRGRYLRSQAYIWLGLNSLLVVSAFARNFLYISTFGLTFKRIGVIIFLILCLIGLVFTAYKIMKKKTNFFLINNMFYLCFFVFIITSLINWSSIVTKYNIKYESKPDWEYLIRLNYNKHLILQSNNYENLNDHAKLMLKNYESEVKYNSILESAGYDLYYLR